MMSTTLSEYALVPPTLDVGLTIYPSPAESTATVSAPRDTEPRYNNEALRPKAIPAGRHRLLRKGSVTSNIPGFSIKHPGRRLVDDVRSSFPSLNGRGHKSNDGSKGSKPRLSLGPISISSPFPSLRPRQSKPPPSFPPQPLNHPKPKPRWSLDRPTIAHGQTVPANISSVVQNASPLPKSPTTDVSPGEDNEVFVTNERGSVVVDDQPATDKSDRPAIIPTANGTTTSPNSNSTMTPRHRPHLHVRPFSSPALVTQTVPEHEVLTDTPSHMVSSSSAECPLKSVSAPSSPSFSITSSVDHTSHEKVWLCSRPSPRQSHTTGAAASPEHHSPGDQKSPQPSPTTPVVSVTSLSLRRKLRPLVVRANSTGPGAKIDENGAVMYLSLHSERVVATTLTKDLQHVNPSGFSTPVGEKEEKEINADFGPRLSCHEPDVGKGLSQVPSVRRANTVSGPRLARTDSRSPGMSTVGTPPTWRGASGPNGWNWGWVFL